MRFLTCMIVGIFAMSIGYFKLAMLFFGGGFLFFTLPGWAVLGIAGIVLLTIGSLVLASIVWLVNRGQEALQEHKRRLALRELQRRE